MTHATPNRIVAALLVVFMAAAAFLALPAKPAHASYGDCVTNRICTWKGSGGTGAMYYYTGPFNTCINIGSAWNDSISSVANTWSNNAHYAYLFEHANCFNYPGNTGWQVYLITNKAVSFGADHDNEMSSLYITS